MPPVSYTCPSCRAVLKTPNAIPAGRTVKCPKCAHAFAPGGATGVQASRPSAQGGPRPTAGSFAGTPIRPNRPSMQGVKKKPANWPLRIAMSFLFMFFYMTGGTAVAYFVLYPAYVAQVTSGSGKNTTGDKKTTDESTTRPGPGPGPGPGPDPSKPPETPPEPPPSNTGNSSEPITYLPNGSTFFLGLGINTLLNKPELASTIDPMLKKKELKFLNDVSKETGLSLKKDIEQVVLGLTASIEAAQVADATVAIKTKAPMDVAKVSKALATGDKQDLHGMPYYETNKLAPFVGFFVPNNRILVLTTQSVEQLVVILKPDLTKPSIDADAMKVIRRVEKNQVWVAVPLDDLSRKDMKKATAGFMEDVPPEMKPAVDALLQAKSFTFWGGIEDKKLKFSLAVDCADDKAAQDLASGGENAWDTYVKKGLEDGGPLKELMGPLSTMLEATTKELANDTKFVRQGTLVTMSIALSVEPLEKLGQDLEKDPGALGKMPGPGPGPANDPELAKSEAELVKVINDLRKAQNRPLLKQDAKLSKVAREHAAKMEKGQVNLQELANDATKAGYQYKRISIIPPLKMNAKPNAVVYRALVQGFQNSVLDKNWDELGVGLAKDKANNYYLIIVFSDSGKN